MKPFLVDFSRIESKPWVLAAVWGQRTKNGSADTLKKQWASLSAKAPSHTPSSESFVQVLPSRVAVSPSHMEWVGLGVLRALESNSLHFRQPSLEFVARAAGTFQWKDALPRITLSSKDENVVLIWMGPRDEWSPTLFSRLQKEWGFVPAKKIPQVDERVELNAIESSALSGLE